MDKEVQKQLIRGISLIIALLNFMGCNDEKHSEKEKSIDTLKVNNIELLFPENSFLVGQKNGDVFHIKNGKDTIKVSDINIHINLYDRIIEDGAYEIKKNKKCWDGTKSMIFSGDDMVRMVIVFIADTNNILDNTNRALFFESKLRAENTNDNVMSFYNNIIEKNCDLEIVKEWEKRN